jgi:hypothetical protein
MSEPVRIPRLAGLCSLEEAFRNGIPVEENVRFLKRLNYIKARLYEIQVKHMNSTPEWEVKGAFSLHLWLDSEHAVALRKRVSEMREPPLHLDKIPDTRLESLMNEIIYANSTFELLSGIYDVIRPALLKAYLEHAVRTNPLVDHPTCRILRFIAQEEEDMIRWGQEALQVLAGNESGRQQRVEWADHLTAYLTFARGVTGNAEPAEDLKLPEPRAIKLFEADYTPLRDSCFQDLFNTVLTADEVYLDPSKEANERVWALMYKRLREIDVPEMQCSIVGETTGKPWAYYNDMGRQIWDEARHSMMGEAAFEHNEVDWRELPIRVNFSYELNTMLTPEERHALLYEIEFGLMPGDTGKKYEWEIAKESGYELAVTFQDYDWADEVLHAQIGRKWIVKDLGGIEQTLLLAARAREKLNEKRGNYVSKNPNWWRDFYHRVKERGFRNPRKAK